MTYDVILAQKCRNFDDFPLKWAFRELETLLNIATNRNPIGHSVASPLKQFSKFKYGVNLRYDVIFAQKCRHFDNFPLKWAFFEKLTLLKPLLNIAMNRNPIGCTVARILKQFSKFNYDVNVAYDVILAQNDVILIILPLNGLFSRTWHS